jgi:hypothetical protein
MFGGNNYNNRNNSADVTTRIRTFYSDLSALVINYWNDRISIKIHPVQSINDDGVRQYDYTKKIATALMQDKCIALTKKVDELLFPAMEKVKAGEKLEKPLNTGVIVGAKNSGIFIEYKEDDKGVPSFFLTIYTNIGQDKKAPKDGVYSYKFSKVDIIEDYDPDNGTGKDDYVEAEFMFFYEKLKNISSVISDAAHSIDYKNSTSSSTSNNYNANNYNMNNYNANRGQMNMQNPSIQADVQAPAPQNYSAPVSSFDDGNFLFA